MSASDGAPLPDDLEACQSELEECQSELDGVRHAMESRPVIDQAKGILMSRHRCSPDEAFAMLSQASQRENRKVRDIARAIVDGIQDGAGARATEPPRGSVDSDLAS